MRHLQPIFTYFVYKYIVSIAKVRYYAYICVLNTRNKHIYNEKQTTQDSALRSTHM